MTTTEAEGDAVRYARRGDFSKGVKFSSLEGLVARRLPRLRSSANIVAGLGLVQAAAMIAPFAGILAPVGNTDFGWFVESDGLRGGTLLRATLVSFTAGALGQLWILIDWWLTGRQRASAFRYAAAASVVCSALALWWFSSLMGSLDYQFVVLPIALTGFIGSVSFVAQLVASSSTTRWEGRQLKFAQRMQGLTGEEQQILRDERRSVLEVLQQRGVIDATTAAHADAAALGDWWRIDRDAQI